MTPAGQAGGRAVVAYQEPRASCLALAEPQQRPLQAPFEGQCQDTCRWRSQCWL